MTRKTRALYYLRWARDCLNAHNVTAARSFLGAYRIVREHTPASTLRRWKCGK